MSDAPTSADSVPDPRALLAAGWREAELAWERLQERGLEAAAAGQDDAAAGCWAEALRLARAEFTEPDPRLAASLANYALGLRCGGDAATATTLLAEALRVWDASQSWVAALAPERRARSSTFHLRLQRKHPGSYEHFSRERHAALAAAGRAAVRALHEGAEPDAKAAKAALERWRRERPAGFTDGRRLMAAAIFVPSPAAVARP